MEHVEDAKLNGAAASGGDYEALVNGSADGTLLAQIRTFLAVFWGSPQRARLIVLTVAILTVIGLTVVGQLRLNAWFKDFYDAIESRRFDAFALQLLVFAAIVIGLLILNVAQTWINRMIKLRTRERLTRDLVTQWLIPKRDFLLAGAGAIGRNPDQRIHEDAHHLSELSADLAIGLVQAFLLLVSFIGVLWVLSSGVVFTINQHTLAIPGYMVWCALLYAAIGSVLSWAVGRPLVPLNVELYAREADLRFELVRTSENIDGIALYGGEAREASWLDAEIDRLLVVIRRIVGAITRLTWVTAGYGWFAIVIPIVAAAPGYFQGHLTFGDLMMVAGAFNQVQQSLRWFVDNFGTLADWRATLRRVIGFRQCLLRLDHADGGTSRIKVAHGTSSAITFADVVITLPEGGATLEPSTVEVAPGAHVLILGKAGSGKSYLFRAIAGLWPWGSGTISLPEGARRSFLPQRPYVPPGTLQAALCYPVAAEKPDDAALAAALLRVGLGHLVPSLNTVRRWDKDLSPEAQQRLSFARLLLSKPDCVFLDEAFDILDEDSREMVLSIFAEELATTTIVSFARSRAQYTGFTCVAHLVAAAPVAQHGVKGQRA